MSNTISNITVMTIDGKPKPLSDYAGQVLLIVNVASQCGYTPQYKGLEQLNQRYKDQGLRVLSFPCNDFGAQEPGTNEEIVQFCDRNYGVTFDLFDKVHAKGASQDPLYKTLTDSVIPAGEVSWNFEKFLISKTGDVIARYRSSVSPDAPELISAIEQELAK